jgi:hypothetical protein
MENEAFYAIQLSYKYHNDHDVWLGIKHKTKQDAIAYAEKEVCQRCNRIEYYKFPVEYEWVDRKKGFLPPTA